MIEKNFELNLGNSVVLSVEEVINRLLHGNFELFVTTLNNRGIFFPKSLRISVLKVALQDYVNEYVEANRGKGNELAYRLTFFKIYSEFQLSNILNQVPQGTRESYIYLLVNHILDTLVANGIDLSILNFVGSVKVSASELNVVKMDSDADKLFVDELKNIDGVSLDYIRPLLYNGSLSEEIIALGKKYDIDIPKRIRKRELIENIVYQFHLNHDEALKLSDQLFEKPIVLVERYAKDHGIKISSDLKKEDMIEYLLVRHDASKNTYLKPTSLDVYHFTKEQQEALGVTEEYELTTQTNVITEEVVNTSTQITQVTHTTTDGSNSKSYGDLIAHLNDLEEKLKEEPKTVALEEKFAFDPVKEAKRHRFLELLLLFVIAISLIFIVVAIILTVYFTTTASVDSTFKDGVDEIINYVKIKGHGLADLARSWVHSAFGLGA